MIKILLVTPELQYTGACQSFRRMCIVLLNNGYQIHVWSYKQGAFCDEFTKLGISVRVIDEDKIDHKFIYENTSKFNLIIANTVVTYRVADLAKDLIPVIWYIREAENLPDFFWKKERKLALENAKKLYVVSEYAQAFIKTNYNDNVEVVHNFVDDVFGQENTVISHNTKIKFLAMGTVEKRKGYDVLIEAFLQLPPQYLELCELHFAGRLWDGAQNFYPQILENIKEHSNIFYHGELRKRNEIHKLIQHCDVVVVPSRDESCSLVALEGAMLSKPLILSENIGAKYIVNASCGWIVKTGDSDSLRQAYIEAVENKTKLIQMGKIARENYLATSTYEIYEKNILNMVKDNIVTHLYKHKIDIEKYAFFSFDIFDTLVTRKTITPLGVFSIIQEKLCQDTSPIQIPSHVKENFCEIRTRTEKFMYQKVCNEVKRDVTIYEIYERIAYQYGLSDSVVKKIIDLEIEIETTHMLPIRENIELVNELIVQGKKVVLISDMYFPSKIIRYFLSTFSNAFNLIPIYVSCDCNAKKNNGKLFHVVQEKEHVKFSEWVHFGDNIIGDIKEPQKLDITTVHYDFFIQKPYQKLLLNSASHIIASQLSLGVSRYACIEKKLFGKAEFGACFAGPVLLPYIKWILDHALNKHLTKLYFVARDGYLLQQIANIIIEKRKLPIETKYLYGSRIAWRDPYREESDQEKLNIVAYLKQEIDFKETFAFVEFAGTGETQDCLMRIISEYNLGEVYDTYYFYHTRDVMQQHSPKFSFLPLNNEFSTILELLVRAPHGQTVGYHENSGNIYPELEDNEGEALIAYGYNDYIKGVLAFVESAYENSENNLTYMDSCVVPLNYIKYLLSENIDVETADFLGGIPFIIDGVNSETIEYAPAISLEDVHNIYEKKCLKLKTHNSNISECRSDSNVRRLIKKYKSTGQQKGDSYDDIIEKNIKFKKLIRRLENELACINKSASFRIGRKITFIPRKIRGLSYCLRDHGFRYTLKHGRNKVILLLKGIFESNLRR